MRSDLSSYYTNNECLRSNIGFTPERDLCYAPIPNIPPDGDPQTRKDNFAMAVGKEKNHCVSLNAPIPIVILGGCDEDAPNVPPSYDDPSFKQISTANWSENPAINYDGSVVAFEQGRPDIYENSEDPSIGSRNIYVYNKNTDKLERVDGNGRSYFPSIDSEGRYIAFVSTADNLVSNDNNGKLDVFVRDIKEKKTTRASVSSAGEEGNDDSLIPKISANGRYVAFNSYATNLVPFGTTDVSGVYVYDMQTKKIVRITDIDGIEANGSSGAPAINGDGSLVAFGSWADNLVNDDINNAYDLFMRDLINDSITRVSVPYIAEKQADDSSGLPVFSAEGKYVAFESKATNLLKGDANKGWDVFVYDVENETLSSPSVKTGDGWSTLPSISDNGKFVTFASDNKITKDDDDKNFDIYVSNILSGVTMLVSHSKKGEEIVEGCVDSAISGDGKHIIFSAYSDGYRYLFMTQNPLF